MMIQVLSLKRSSGPPSLIQQADCPVHNAIDPLAVDGAHRNSRDIADPAFLDAAGMGLPAGGDAFEVLLELAEIFLRAGQVGLGRNHEPRLPGDVQPSRRRGSGIVGRQEVDRLTVAGPAVIPVDARSRLAVVLLLPAHLGIQADLVPERFEGLDGVPGRQVDDKGQDAGALDVPQKGDAEAAVEVGALDEPRDVGDGEAGARVGNVTATAAGGVEMLLLLLLLLTSHGLGQRPPRILVQDDGADVGLQGGEGPAADAGAGCW